ncbi:MAG: AlpA family phage regulatory protein [Caldimonas sp.]
MERNEIALSRQTQIDPLSIEFLRLPLVIRRTGLGRSTIYRMVAAQTFPPPVRLAGRAVGWRRTDLDRWSADRPPAGH